MAHHCVIPADYVAARPTSRCPPQSDAATVQRPRSEVRQAVRPVSNSAGLRQQYHFPLAKLEEVAEADSAPRAATEERKEYNRSGPTEWLAAVWAPPEAGMVWVERLTRTFGAGAAIGRTSDPMNRELFE